MGDENQVDSFDDLFEPFELEDGPPAAGAPPATPTPPPEAEDGEHQHVPMVSCPSCGMANPAYNRHCEACGARLSTAPLPVAPPPMVRATPGGRALGVLVAVVLIVTLVALFMNIFGNDDPVDDPGSTTLAATSTTAPTTTAAPVEELTPSTVEASSELGTQFRAENLIDGSLATEWQDRSLSGEGATITFRFNQPVAINEIEIYNIPEETRFRQNHRIRGYRITVDDLSFDIPGELRNVNTRQVIEVATVETLRLTIEVTSTYASEAVDGGVPFTELAIADIRFFGRLSN